jgi:DNA polymerase-3 subunit delta
MQILLELDKSLKSQPVSAQTLLETALCRLAMAGGRR